VHTKPHKITLTFAKKLQNSLLNKRFSALHQTIVKVRTVLLRLLSAWGIG